MDLFTDIMKSDSKDYLGAAISYQEALTKDPNLTIASGRFLNPCRWG